MKLRVRWLLTLLVWSLAAAASSAATAAPRTLLISLDAVPFWVVDDLSDPESEADAPFASFKGPVPLVSTFPSSTSVAMVGLLGPLGLEKSPGYEAKFYDWRRGRVRGGGPFSYAKIKFPWRDFFDWSRKSPAGSAVEALKPVKSGTKRLRRAIEEFALSDVEVLLVYIAATDTAVHVVGPDSVKSLLTELDDMLREAHRRRPDRPFETIIFSDHGVAGGEPLVNVSKATKKALKAAGYRLGKRLSKPRSVVMTPFGLVSNLEAYTRDEDKLDVARILAGVKGVEICVVRLEEASWRAFGAAGSALFERDDSGPQRRWRYTVEGEDPLGYETFFAPGSSPASDDGGWLEDEALFEATQKHRFPDALHRMADAFSLVSNPASVVCSTGTLYMYGARSTALLAKIGKGKLRWTHGSLRAAATTGFLMSDVADWQAPEVARYDRALTPFRELLGRHPHVVTPQTVDSTD